MSVPEHIKNKRLKEDEQVQGSVPAHIKRRRLKEDEEVRGDDFFSRPIIAYIFLAVFLVVIIVGI